MMQFVDSPAHNEIVAAIKQGLAARGLEGVRADEKEYHESLFPNVQTYMHGCAFGIAVFERIEAEQFNPNVALEVGYMYSMSKRICFLKDRTLKSLHADLIDRLYKPFDTQRVTETIPPLIEKWITDWGLASD